MSRRILVADDDANIRQVVVFALRKAGFDTVEAADGPEALARFDERGADLVVLDIVMPGMEGTDVCRRLRERASVPIVFLSSKDEEIDRIVGLEIGGDDYVTKPFSPRELVARVRSVLRRIDETVAAASAPEPEGALRHGRLELDPDRFRVLWDGQPLELTATEFGIVRTLLARPGTVCSRDHLMDGAYDTHRIVSDRTIDSHVRRVRAKFKALGIDPIETVHSVGYKLGDCG